ncbi:hypothetical protein AZI85_00800 [Bdellovibrio bacteriovorus]|uniref:Uncharacterized protein n=1 Tax=Bdellovibrio bacteriovorus TaxID=959 RepID=A0A150WVF7_BDEBC|nr:hypothetical protein [Bdellovibrio bacteriovorus]KYG70517.1 hypothetical protein AZI85_00800 [Bdellovibrio bacteriovorus]
MKSWLKVAAPVVLVVSSVAVASVINKEEVNKKVAAIAAAYNNESTKLDVAFTELRVDAVRTLDFALKASAYKKGPANELYLQLNNASYHYGDGSAPRVAGDLAVKFDLVKAFGQSILNEFGGQLEDLVKSLVGDYGQKYGDAITVQVVMDELQKDAEGNIISAKLHLQASVDFQKLPANLKIEDVEFKSLQARLGADRTGLSGSIEVLINPAFKGFNADQPGLKDFIEKLLADDKDTLESVARNMQMVDDIATYLVTHTPEEQKPAPTPEPQP